MTHHNGVYGNADTTQQSEIADGSVGNAETGADTTDTNSATGMHNAASTTLENLTQYEKKPVNKGLIAAMVAAIVGVLLIVWVLVPHNKPQSESVLRVGLQLAPTNLDIRNQSGSALDQILIGNVMEGLVARDENNQVIPALAEHWEESNNGLAWTFTLHKNMHFSNGDELDSSDVVWSLNQMKEKQYHGSQYLDSVQQVRAENPTTVVLELSQPDSDLLWQLTGRPGLVFDKDARYDAKRTAVGSGPYLVQNFVANQSLTLTKNPKYWGNPATIDTVEISYIADENAGLNALKSGNVDVLSPVNATMAKTLAKDSRFTVAAGEGTDKFVLAFNSAQGATSDIRVRQALRYAIDKQEIIASRSGVDAPLGGPIPSLDPGYEDLTGLYPHDEAKAKQLLEQAGYSRSNPLTLRLEYANIYGTQLGEQLRSQLAKVGVNLDVRVVEFSTWLQDVYTNKDYDISLVDHNESRDISQWANPQYYYNYNNAHVQELITQARHAVSQDKASQYLSQAAREISQDAPAEWLFNYRITTAVTKKVKGFPLNMNQSLLPLYNVSLSE